jgi:hypothetical protein
MHEKFRNIKRATLDNQYLKPLNTKWFISRVLRSERTGESTPTTLVDHHAAVLTVRRLDNKYLIELTLPLSRQRIYTYDFYKKGGARDKSGSINRANQDNQWPDFEPVDVDCSAVYAYYLAKRLSMYREIIDAYALDDLDWAMHSTNGRPPGGYAHMTPQLFYRYLLRKVRDGGAADLIAIIKPGNTQTESLGESLQWILRPVYGPAHQPLRLTHRRAHREYRVFFGEERTVPSTGVQPGDVILPRGPNSRHNVSFDIVAFVAILSREMATNPHHRTGTSLDWLFELYRQKPPDAETLSGLSVDAVSSVMALDVLFAIKAAQLYMPPESSDREQMLKAKELRQFVLDEHTKVLLSDAWGNTLSRDDQNLVEERTVQTLKNLIDDLRTLSAQ